MEAAGNDPSLDRKLKKDAELTRRLILHEAQTGKVHMTYDYNGEPIRVVKPVVKTEDWSGAGFYDGN